MKRRLLFFCSIFCLLVLFATLSFERISRIGWNEGASLHPSSVVFRFSEGLRQNDPDIYELVDPAAWPKLDIWMNEHKTKTCIYIPENQYGGTNFTDSTGNTFYTTIFNCDINGANYKITIEDIRIANVGGQYVVRDWGQPVEVLR